MPKHPHEAESTTARTPRSYILLSILAAIITIALKAMAYRITNSVGLLSDATESVVNLVAALVAFWVLTVAALPPDEEHTYGHSKAEYFSSGVEAVLILAAAAGIVWVAIRRFMHPTPLTQVSLGLGISMVAAAVNGGTAWVLWRAGKRLDSISLRADAHHLYLDVWTSVSVLVSVLLVQLTGWLVLDPLIAIAVAMNIVYIGYRLLDDTIHGLLDTAMPAADQEIVARTLEQFRRDGIEFHAFRSRVSGPRRFLSMHVLVPGGWTVQKGHDLCETIERSLVDALPRLTVFTHLEPCEDPRAFADQGLDRTDRPPRSS